MFGVWLGLDGRRIEPAEFSPAVLGFGDRLALQFAVPRLDAGSKMARWADGYYEISPE